MSGRRATLREQHDELVRLTRVLGKEIRKAMTITLEIRGTSGDQRGGDVQLRLPSGRWFRLALYVDPPPRMSHIGLWRTRAGRLRGLNLRVKVPGGYATALAHTSVSDYYLRRD